MPTRANNHEPRRNNRSTRRVFALLAATMLSVLVFAPSAAAELGEHTVCIADSDGVERPSDPGTGCARATIRTVHACWDDPGTAWTCDVRAEPLGVEVSGVNTCGSANLAGDGDRAMACTDVRDEDAPFPHREDSIDTDVDRYTDIPAKGRTVEVPVETCTWPNGLPELAHCVTWTHVHRLPGNPNDSGGVFEFVFDTFDGVVEYVDAVVGNAESPATVAP